MHGFQREKISHSFVKLREQILEKQLALLAGEEPQNQMSLAETSAVIENHGPSVYDKMLSHPTPSSTRMMTSK